MPVVPPEGWYIAFWGAAFIIERITRFYITRAAIESAYRRLPPREINLHRFPPAAALAPSPSPPAKVDPSAPRLETRF